MRATPSRLLSCLLLIACLQPTFCLETFNATIEPVDHTGWKETSSKSAFALQDGSLLPRSRSSELATEGLAAANVCWSQWEAYSKHSTHCQQTTTSVLSNTLTSVMTSIAYDTFKLCDGHPRARAAGSERTSTFTETIVLSASLVSISNSTFFTRHGTSLSYQTTVLPASGIPVSTATTTKVFTNTLPQTRCIITEPTPQCTIDSNNCRSLFSTWSAGNFTRSVPPCHYDPPKDPCVQCNIYIPSVKLLYFPVSMTGNFCGDYSTVDTTITNANKPPTVEVSGTTFTSGFAYFSYDAIIPGNGGGICGQKRSAGVLAVPSSEVSSYRGHVPALQQAGDVKWSFNFADLAPNPVPWDAWIGQQTCAEHVHSPNCQIITQAAYRPALAYPRQLWSLDSKWSDCSYGAFGIVDPPTALVVAGEVAGPTYASGPPITSSPALPRPSRSDELPTVTSVQSSLAAGNDGSATVARSIPETVASPYSTTGIVPSTTEHPIITVDPISGSFLPEITTIANTGEVSVIDTSSTPSNPPSIPSTGSGHALLAPACVYTITALLIVLLLALPVA